MQTARDSDVRNVREGSRAPGDVHSGKHPTPRAERSSNRPGLVQLWKQEGPRFLYAGAAAPIIGLAFLDSFFFGAYGRSMSVTSSPHTSVCPLKADLNCYKSQGHIYNKIDKTHPHFLEYFSRARQLGQYLPSCRLL